MVTGLYVPRWGITMERATIVAWHAEEGDRVASGDDLVELETEKMVNVVSAPGGGLLRKVLRHEGDVVQVGELIGVLAEADEDFDLEALRGAGPSRTESGAAGLHRREPTPAQKTDGGRVRASPAAKKLAAERGVDLAAVEGTGPEGSITREDVERWEEIQFSQEVDGFVDVDGLRLHYVASGQPGGRPPILLLHGLGGSGLLWQPNLTALSRVRRAIALDLPGHGRSEKPDVAYDLEFFVSIVLRFLDALGIGRAALVGNSLGGQVALKIALDHPTRVERLVLVASGGLGPEINLDFLRPLLSDLNRENVETMLRGLFRDSRFVTAAMVNATLRGFEEEGALTAVRRASATLTHFGRQKHEFADRLGELASPVLLAWGSADAILPMQHAERAQSLLPHAELWVAEGVGHCPQLESSEEFNRRATEFLSKD
jgi:pyruvate dehydrogenase E2 component (dihydrolipoamide acetyltransferase)